MVDTGYIQGGSRIYSHGVAGQKEKNLKNQCCFQALFEHFYSTT